MHAVCSSTAQNLYRWVNMYKVLVASLLKMTSFSSICRTRNALPRIWCIYYICVFDGSAPKHRPSVLSFCLWFHAWHMHYHRKFSFARHVNFIERFDWELKFSGLITSRRQKLLEPVFLMFKHVVSSRLEDPWCHHRPSRTAMAWAHVSWKTWNDVWWWWNSGAWPENTGWRA